ncbi:hypothetical protein AALP_AA4G231900 [Arabis alpina]|uniref:Uncharacterized protein n=1 Tax=Arabis alpina TaxID=50452 RepID=A0A087H537_ARAAL|nr:hypothetical protein AALP_AA4G231900 [Arabis alpina]
MGNCLTISDRTPEDVSEKLHKAFPVETTFKFPSPLPTFTQGLYYLLFLLITLLIGLMISIFLANHQVVAGLQKEPSTWEVSR